MKTNLYETPCTQIVRVYPESAILSGSVLDKGGAASIDSFSGEETDYQW